MRVKPFDFNAIIQDVVTDFGRVGEEAGDVGRREFLPALQAESLAVGAMRFVSAVPETEGSIV